ncbi:hypothetical protein [Mongoliibacter ruber]|uniref:Uncharacterized protein n=1 Tax=Mongoliibacter ruber TaxID=1750599 RepID=A0A2T0WN66_9BACT|nr:hypothetical protein [Mongoliibacter ruber]PRY88122.1 hypothetical protein CLW00_105243 [Mongoliibacter ruber]
MKIDIKFLLLLITLSCKLPEKNEFDLCKRLGVIEENLNVEKSGFYMFVDFDNCPNCSELLKSRITWFLKDYDGSVIVSVRNKKKAKLILGDSLFNKVNFDIVGISKDLNLINDTPVIYQMKEGECDSFIINLFN